MFNNLSFRPKSPRPAGSVAEPSTASQGHVADQISQSTNMLSNTPSAHSRRARNKYVRIDMSDFELFTPGARTHSGSSALEFDFESGGNDIGYGSDIGNEHVPDMPYEVDSGSYNSTSLQAKSVAKRKSKSGSGVGATSSFSSTRRTAKTISDRSERGSGSSRQSLSSRSGITNQTSSVRGSCDTLGHGRKTSSTTGKLDSISVSTWEAYANLNTIGKDDNNDDTFYTTVDTPTLWYALSCIPGFLFPTLYSFLHDTHAWLDTTGHGAGGNGSGTVYNTEDCIDSLNTDMPLGRRAQALDRLASVLSSPDIQRVCGSSVVRKRVPNFIRTIMEEPSRIWSAEAAAVGRQLSFLTAALERNDGSFRDRNLSPTPLAASLDRVLARRFNLSAPSAMGSSPVDANIMSDGDVAFKNTTVDGNALAAAMQDLMSILASARGFFEKKRALQPLREPTNAAPTREQQAVYKAFDAANITMQRLQDVQRQLSHCEATANGQLTMEDDLVDSLQSALGAM